MTKRGSSSQSSSSSKLDEPAQKTRDAKKHLSDYLSYACAKGKCPEEQALAVSMKREYDSLDKDTASQFAVKFMETKKTKDFSWHKGFKESLSATKNEVTEVKENYMTLSWP